MRGAGKNIKSPFNERCLTIGKQGLRVNEAIRAQSVRLIDESNTQIGIVNFQEALARAREVGLDLVEVAPNSEPPVCRIMDYGKWLYEQKRKSKQAHKKQHAAVLKEIRFTPKIDKHDLDIKINHAVKFLEKGYKVQFTLVFRGREMMHVEQGYDMMDQILQALEPYAKVDRPCKMVGRRMTIVLSHK